MSPTNGITGGGIFSSCITERLEKRKKTHKDAYYLYYHYYSQAQDVNEKDMHFLNARMLYTLEMGYSDNEWSTHFADWFYKHTQINPVVVDKVY